MFEVKNVSKIYIKEEVKEKLYEIYRMLYDIDNNLSTLLENESNITFDEDKEYIDTLIDIHNFVEDFIDIYNDHTD